MALKGGGIGGFSLEVASDIEKGSNILRIFMADIDGAVVVKDAAELEKLKTVTAESGKFLPDIAATALRALIPKLMLHPFR